MSGAGRGLVVGRNCSADTLLALRRPCVAAPDRHPLRGVVGLCECPCDRKEPFFTSVACCICALPRLTPRLCAWMNVSSSWLCNLHSISAQKCSADVPDRLPLHVHLVFAAGAGHAPRQGEAWGLCSVGCDLQSCSQVQFKWCYEGCGQCRGQCFVCRCRTCFICQGEASC